MDSENRGTIPEYLRGNIETEHQRLNVTPVRSPLIKGPAQDTPMPRRGVGGRVQGEQPQQQPPPQQPSPQMQEVHALDPNVRPPQWVAEERPPITDEEVRQLFTPRAATSGANPPLHVGAENATWQNKKVGNRMDQASGVELLLNLEPGEHCLLVKDQPVERSQDIKWLLEEGQRLLLENKCHLEDISIYTKVALDFGLVIKT